MDFGEQGTQQIKAYNIGMTYYVSLVLVSLPARSLCVCAFLLYRRVRVGEDNGSPGPFLASDIVGTVHLQAAVVQHQVLLHPTESVEGTLGGGFRYCPPLLGMIEIH